MEKETVNEEKWLQICELTFFFFTIVGTAVLSNGYFQ
jgi:hypothetical protein